MTVAKEILQPQPSVRVLCDDAFEDALADLFEAKNPEAEEAIVQK